MANIGVDSDGSTDVDCKSTCTTYELDSRYCGVFVFTASVWLDRLWIGHCLMGSVPTYYGSAAC